MATVSLDPHIRLKLCDELKDVAKEIFDEELDIIDTIQLKELRSHIETPGQFHKLISKCELVIPEPEYSPRNPELEARIQKLKNLQDQKEYDRMTDNVDPWKKIQILEKDDKPIGQQIQELNRYLVLIFQFVISLVSAFAFGYLAPYYFYGTLAVGPRLLYGIISAFVVGMADLYFVIRHLLEVEGVIDLTEKKQK